MRARTSRCCWGCSASGIATCWGLGTHAIIPYDQRLARFPAYLQQLDMEIERQARARSTARPSAWRPAPVVWGEPGTNGQHAFFQLIHQGTDVIPVDFLVAAEPIEADRASSRTAVRQLPRAGRGADARALAPTRPMRMLAKQGLSRRGRRRAGAPQGVSTATGRRAPSSIAASTRARSAASSRSTSTRSSSQGGDLGHQLLRPMGRRARQGTGEPPRADRGR